MNCEAVEEGRDAGRCDVERRKSSGAIGENLMCNASRDIFGTGVDIVEAAPRFATDDRVVEVGAREIGRENEVKYFGV